MNKKNFVTIVTVVLIRRRKANIERVIHFTNTVSDVNFTKLKSYVRSNTMNKIGHAVATPTKS